MVRCLRWAPNRSPRAQVPFVGRRFPLEAADIDGSMSLGSGFCATDLAPRRCSTTWRKTLGRPSPPITNGNPFDFSHRAWLMACCARSTVPAFRYSAKSHLGVSCRIGLLSLDRRHPCCGRSRRAPEDGAILRHHPAGGSTDCGNPSAPAYLPLTCAALAAEILSIRGPGWTLRFSWGRYRASG